MDNISQELKEDYERWISKIGKDPYSGKITVGIIDVLKAHYLIFDYFSTEYGEGIGGIGPRDLNLLHSTLSRQLTGYDGQKKCGSEFDICATLFFGLIKNHAFHDANKRTAFLTLLYHLRKIERTPDIKQKDYEILALRIASNELEKYPQYSSYKNTQDAEVKFIAHFLKKNTRPVNKNEYIITYRDLDSILRKFHYGFENPDNNRIDIVRFSEETSGIINRKKVTTSKRIGAIGFPGWKRQIGMQDVKFVRKITGITAENGYDSETFFHNSEPFSALIWQYQNLLKRLADK